MKKLTKLILTGGISLSSLFFNQGYSQQTDENGRKYYILQGERYYINKIISEQFKAPDGEIYNAKIIMEDGRVVYKYKDGALHSVDGWTIYKKKYYLPAKDNKTKIPNISSSNKNPYSPKTSSAQKSKPTYDSYQKTSPSNKSTYTPTYTPKKTKTNSGLNNALLIGGATVGALWLISELAKPRYKAPITNSVPLTPNPQPNYNSNTKDNVDWWKEDKEKNKNWWDDKPKSENLLEKKIKETETKKLWDEEVKKADEFFKEKGIEPYQYKIVRTIEISPNGEIIKKESRLPGRELTDEEKVILYYADYAVRNYTPAGPVLKGIDLVDKLKKEGEWNKKYEESKKIFGQPEEGAPENSFYYGTTKFQKDMKTGLYVAGENLAPQIVKGIENSIDTEKKMKGEGVKNWLNQQIKEEKEVDFLFAKPIGDNTYYYFKLAGKEKLYKNYNESSKIASYIAIKNSPFGDQIINIAKDFKEKVDEFRKEKTASGWWDK